MINIPIKLNSVILGIIISNGNLRKTKSGFTIFSFKQTIHKYTCGSSMNSISTCFAGIFVKVILDYKLLN